VTYLYKISNSCSRAHIRPTDLYAESRLFFVLEPEVHLIEKYFQEIKGCFTRTNVKCKGGKEIDLLAINPISLKKYHVESRVSTAFVLRPEATYTKSGKCHKNGLDYFAEEKFDHPRVKERIREIFGVEDYARVLVVWDVSHNSVINLANEKFGINIWFIEGLINGLIQRRAVSGSRDDVLRVVEFLSALEKQRTGEAYKRRLVRLGAGYESPEI